MQLGSSRRHRESRSLRKDEYALWTHESDSDRPRQSTSQPPRVERDRDGEYSVGGTGIDRHHRSSRRVDVSNNAPLSSASAANRSASARQAVNGTQYQAYTTVPPSQKQAAPAPPTTSSRSRTQDNNHAGYDLRTYQQRRVDRRSPRSSEERLHAPEYLTSSRGTAQPARTSFIAANPTPQTTYPPPSHWGVQAPSARDPMSSSRQYRDREAEREESKEQRRERKARERAMREAEQERIMASTNRQADYPRERAPAPEVNGEERMKDLPSDRDELERQRRHEDRERRREERRREERRREEEQRRRGDEEERARRHTESSRKRYKDKEGYTRDDGLQYYAVYPQSAPPQTARSFASSRHKADDRNSTRHGPFLSDQIPSSSSNVALPATLSGQTAGNARSEGVSDARRDDYTTSAPQPSAGEKELKRHRSKREKLLPAIQQAAQDSGFSSSEQDLSARERERGYRRTRRRTREDDGQPSGPSGSETERVLGMKDRRATHRTDVESMHQPESARRPDSRQNTTYPSQTSFHTPLGLVGSATVGVLDSQRVGPQVVSIRAGQGPADPQTPSLRSKTPVASLGRGRDTQTGVSQAQTSTASAAAAVSSTTQPAPQTPYRPDYPSQSHSGAQSYSRTAGPPAVTVDTSRPSPAPHAGTAYTNGPQVQSPVQYTGTNSTAGATYGSSQQPTPTFPYPSNAQHPASAPAQSQSGPSHPSHQHLTMPNSSSTGAYEQPSHGRTAPQQHLQPPAVSKSSSGSSPGKGSIPYPQPSALDHSGQASAQVARLSVYHAPGPAVTADLVLPLSANADRSVDNARNGGSGKAAAQELPPRFPVQEDYLSPASSSTLAPGANRSVPFQGQAYQDNGGPQAGSAPARNSMYTPLLRGVPVPNESAIVFSPMKPSGQTLHVENDVPIPVPAPKVATGQDPSPHQHTTQIVSHGYEQGTPPQGMTHRPIRSMTAPAHIAAPTTPSAPNYLGGHPGASSNSARYAQQTAVSTHTPGATMAILNSSSHSPGRINQHNPQPSPGSRLAAQLGPPTPKLSPSGRLVPRNNSTETVTYGGAKNSPHDPTRSLKQRNSNSSMRAVQPTNTNTSRPDTRSSRPPHTGEYPDTARYRSMQTANPYPSSQPQTQASNNYGQYANPSSNPPPSVSHNRSASQPTAQSAPYELPQRHRSSTVPVMPISTPAAAPSASALAAAYRSGLYTSDRPPRQQEIQRGPPPRTAPSPAPSAEQAYAPQPVLQPRTGFATTTPAPPVRSQPTLPATARHIPPPINTSHPRNVSDPQLARVAISGHPSTPAPMKAGLAHHPNASQELLKTPSSIARSFSRASQLIPPPARAGPAPPTQPPTPQSAPAGKEKDPSRRRNLFSGINIFRSKSSPPKEEAASAPAPPKPRQRSTSQTTLTAVAASVRKIVAPHPNPSSSQPQRRGAPTPQQPQQPAHQQQEQQRTPRTSQEDRAYRKAPPSPGQQTILAPTPRPAMADPNALMMESGMQQFHSQFRLVSRKHRAVSDASVEAQDGTVANTVIGGESARSSTAGRLSPPLQDPVEAANTWRIREAALGGRRRRPGVVFDVTDDFTETETHHPARKLGRR